MPWRCCVPGCKGYDEAKSTGVVFHGLPTRDPPRCRLWLRAIRNPRLAEDTPARRFGGVRVCSRHFTADDYEDDFRAKILNTAPKPALKSGAVPSVFPGRERAEPAPKRTRTRVQASCGAAATSSQLPPPPPPPPPPPAAAAADEGFCIVVSVDPLEDDSFHSEPEFNSRRASDESDEDVDKDCTVVYNQNLMELFRMCQTCGQPVVEKEVFHSGALMRVKWSCRGGHSGLWKSSPHLRDVLP